MRARHGLILALLLPMGCSRGEPPVPPVPEQEEASPPDMLLVLVNGLRSDLPGKPYAEAAVLGALAETPKRTFLATYAQSVQPFTSLGSLLTGQYPFRIPLCSPPQNEDGVVDIWCSSIPDGTHTLPQVLSLYGYTTALVLGEDVSDLAPLGVHFGTTLQAPEVETPQAGLSGVTAPLKSWWSEHQDQPRLAVVVTTLVDSDLAKRTIAGQRLGSGALDSLWEAYWQVAQAEGSALAALRSAVDSDVLVLASAHGVSLGETTGTANVPKKDVFHDVVLDRTIHVPLHFFGDGVKSAPSTTHPVELVDFFPTLVGLAGGVPVEGLPGSNLLSLDTPSQEHAYGEFGDMLAYRKGRHLLGVRVWMHGGTSLDPEVDRRLASPEEFKVHQTLHDVVADGLQTRDLVSQQSALAQSLVKELQALRTEGREAVQLDWEQVQALHEVGALSYW